MTLDLPSDFGLVKTLEKYPSLLWDLVITPEERRLLICSWIRICSCWGLLYSKGFFEGAMCSNFSDTPCLTVFTISWSEVIWDHSLILPKIPPALKELVLFTSNPRCKARSFGCGSSFCGSWSPSPCCPCLCLFCPGRSSRTFEELGSFLSIQNELISRQ